MMLKELETAKSILNGKLVTERALIYLRNSGDERQSSLGKTLTNQERYCMDHINANGYQYVDTIAEEPNKHTSGADFDLPGIQKTLAMAERGEFDVLVSKDIDRVSRSQSKFFQLRDMLKIFGVRIELYDFPELGKNVVVDGVKAALAEQDKDDLVKKLVRGQADVVRNNRILKSPSPVYGYTFAFANGKNPKDGYIFIIVEYEAGVVRLIFTLYLKGLGIEAIADYLNEYGYPTPKGEANKQKSAKRRAKVKELLESGLDREEIAIELGYAERTIKKDIKVLNGESDKWRQSTVGHILKNPTYKGTWYYNKKSRIKVYDRDKRKVVKKWVDNPESEWIAITDENIVPPIVSKEVFNATQEKMKSNRKLAKRNTKREYLMSGRMQCHCGTSVMVHSSAPYYYYKCDARHRPKRHNHSCDLPTFTVAEVDNLVWSKLEERIKDPKKLKEGMLEYQQEMSQIAKPLERRLTVIDELIAENEIEFGNAIQNMRLAKGDRAKAIYADDQDRIEMLIDSLKSERQEIVSRLEAEALTDQQINDTLEFAADMAEDWEEISKDFPSKRDFLEFIHAKLTLLTVDGKRKGLLTAKIGVKPIDLCFDNSEKLFTGCNNQTVLIIVIDFD